VPGALVAFVIGWHVRQWEHRKIAEHQDLEASAIASNPEGRAFLLYLRPFDVDAVKIW
jgi:hypothetical protein